MPDFNRASPFPGNFFALRVDFFRTQINTDVAILAPGLVNFDLDQSSLLMLAMPRGVFLNPVFQQLGFINFYSQARPLEDLHIALVDSFNGLAR